MDDTPNLRRIEFVKAVLSEIPGGSIVNFVIDGSKKVQLMQADRVMARILDLLTEDPSILEARIRSDSSLFRLVADTLHAAARADTEGKLEGLARAATIGLEDTARVDEARYLVGVIAQLEAIHVRLLVALEEVAGRDPRENSNIRELLGVTEGIAHGLSAHLLRLGLVLAGGINFDGQHGTARLADFGREILEFLRGSEWRSADTPIQEL